MSSKFATCITCDRPLTPDETVSGFCPRCLFVAGTIPRLEEAVGTESNTLTSSWGEAFPQFEAQQILREEAGFRAIRGTLHSDELEDGYGAAACSSGAVRLSRRKAARIPSLRRSKRCGLRPALGWLPSSTQAT